MAVREQIADPWADAAWMRRALELAGRGRGTTSPNPMVGAVVVAGSAAVGSGYHRRPGEPHAERLALAAAGPRAAGATCYVTLEPCAHHGRTPPCTDALIAAGVTRVVVAMVDPDPQVNGAGVDRLRAAGMRVEVGLDEAAAAELNGGFVMHRTRGRPRVTVKAGASLDGKMAASDGTSQWITGEAARLDAHRWRAWSDALAVGAGTAIADDPLLTARPGGPVGLQPLRVLVDAAGRVPPTARLFGAGGGTLVATTSQAGTTLRRGWAAAGAEVVELPDRGPGRVDLEALVAELGRRGVLELLVEGGPTLHGGFWAAGLVDRVLWYLAPIVLGGGGAGLTGPWTAGTLAAGRALQLRGVDQVGTDLRITAVPVDRGAT